MARYIDAERFEQRIMASPAFPNMGQDGFFLREMVLTILDGQPTADVAPKSEVERLQAEIERLKKDNEYILMQHRFQRRPGGDCWNDVIEKGKAEVAREIFEEVRNSIFQFIIGENCFDDVCHALAKLKKKYTGGE